MIRHDLDSICCHTATAAEHDRNGRLEGMWPTKSPRRSCA